MQIVNSLCNSSNLNISNLNVRDFNNIKTHIRLTVTKTSINHQLNLLKLNKKLKFYSTFKKDCHKTDFLDPIKNTLHKRQVNKFLLGNHNLRIETGRHNKTTENLRICSLCYLNEIEDELHFFIFLSSL